MHEVIETIALVTQQAQSYNIVKVIRTPINAPTVEPLKVVEIMFDRWQNVRHNVYDNKMSW